MNSNTSKVICTIIAKNYISFARTLCNSFLEQHPDGVCYVLIIDEAKGYIDGEKEKFEVVSLDDLNIRNQREFCYKYNITELSTAVKPYLLKYLIDVKSINKILYLDPDILITNPLSILFDELDKHDIILTPHLDKDYPDDGLKPSDSNIMVSGTFNLGFIGVRKSENVNQFLLWWQVKLYDKCVTDFALGYFVDQKFIDYAIVCSKSSLSSTTQDITSLTGTSTAGASALLMTSGDVMKGNCIFYISVIINLRDQIAYQATRHGIT